MGRRAASQPSHLLFSQGPGPPAGNTQFE